MGCFSSFFGFCPALSQLNSNDNLAENSFLMQRVIEAFGPFPVNNKKNNSEEKEDSPDAGVTRASPTTNGSINSALRNKW